MLAILCYCWPALQKFNFEGTEVYNENTMIALVKATATFNSWLYGSANVVAIPHLLSKLSSLARLKISLEEYFRRMKKQEDYTFR